MKFRPPRASGTRDELVAEMEDSVTGWRQFGKDHLSEDAQRAADQLRAGADEVTVGHTTYVVDE